MLNNVSFTQGKAYEPFLEIVYRYNPDAYLEIMKSLRDGFKGTFIEDEQIDRCWTEIVSREELGL